MAEPIDEINNLIEGLKQQRDNLKVQFSLGRAELREEWEELEQKLEQLRSKANLLRRETGMASHNVLEAAKLVADEVRLGYERIRRRL